MNSPPRRPNGRLQACDPCRARKVSCDHARPICHRCVKRNQDGECVYTATAARAKSRRASRQTSAAPPRHGQRRESGEPNAFDFVPDSGYLGFTSHSTVFTEATKTLSSLSGFNSHICDSEECTHAAQTSASAVFHHLPPVVREMCLQVLQCLPGQPGEVMASCGASAESKDWTDIVVRRIMASLQGVFRAYLVEGGARLETLAEIICNNTAQPVRDQDLNPQEWMDQFCGTSLRWESLGLVWAYLEGLSGPLDALRSRCLDWVPGKQCLQTARSRLAYCIELSRHFNKDNCLIVDLCLRKASLESMIEGDASLSCWSSHAIAVSMMTFLGLHDEPNNPAYRPSLCSEYKRRIFARMFYCDKFTVSFTGRPPLLSRRYCSTPLPLDLRDEDLLADEATLMRAVGRLDSRGWNTDGGLYPTTLVRARVMIAVVLDELVEIALSNNTSVTIEHLQSIKARQMGTIASFPSSLRYDPQESTNPDLGTPTLYVRIILQLAHLQNVFFVERLLLRHGEPDEGNLLVTSFDMVTLTLLLWTHKDRFAKMRRGFEWLLMAYAAPGGGILCLELLHPTFRGTHPKDPRLSRSSIIQQLSLLVGCFDWVRPSAPNSDLCCDCKTIIQRVLDHHLNAAVEGGGFLDALDWSFPNQPDFNFELLDTFEWLRTDGQ